jgi:hypothetical protein
LQQAKARWKHPFRAAQALLCPITMRKSLAQKDLLQCRIVASHNPPKRQSDRMAPVQEQQLEESSHE